MGLESVHGREWQELPQSDGRHTDEQRAFGSPETIVEQAQAVQAIRYAEFDPGWGQLPAHDDFRTNPGNKIAEDTPADDSLQGEKTIEDLHRFGRKNPDGPDPVRIFQDLAVKSPDAIYEAQSPTSPRDKIDGASTCTDPSAVPLSGKIYKLPEGIKLPEGLAIHADGKEVGGSRGPGHRTIYGTVSMPAKDFCALVANLPWEHVDDKENKQLRKRNDH